MKINNFHNFCNFYLSNSDKLDNVLKSQSKFLKYTASNCEDKVKQILFCTPAQLQLVEGLTRMRGFQCTRPRQPHRQGRRLQALLAGPSGAAKPTGALKTNEGHQDRCSQKLVIEDGCEITTKTTSACPMSQEVPKLTSYRQLQVNMPVPSHGI